MSTSLEYESISLQCEYEYMSLEYEYEPRLSGDGAGAALLTQVDLDD